MTSVIDAKALLKKSKYGREKWAISEWKMSGKCEMSWAHSFFWEWVWEECTHFFISEKWEWEHSQYMWAVTGLCVCT